jgi:DNA-binding SARP family transcriptional activator/Tfp pilus assembly protein PilF
VLFRVLGAVDLVRSDGVRVSGDASKPWVLLSTLLLHAGEWVRVDRLADALWSDAPPASAAGNIKTYVWKLRRLLAEDERITAGRGGYRIQVADHELDALTFESLVLRGRQAREYRTAAAAFSEALALWRGEPFGELGGPDVDAVRARLVERRLTAQEGHASAMLGLGLHEEAVVALGQSVAEHPFRERLRGLLMTALYRAGRQADAVDVYDQGRVLLDRELGLRPGEELRRLHHGILNQVAELDVVVPRELPRPAQIPAAVGGFTGRAEHLERLDALVPRMQDAVTISVITGTGGVGKTTLAVQWAHRVRDRFPDGQLYVNLRGYDPELPVEPGDALSGFLRALGVDSPDIPVDLEERAARFRSLLSGRRVLVVLDNARTAAQVRPLLPGSPGCLVLVTSRNSLRGLIAKDGAVRVELDLLRPDEARDLLCDLVGDRATADLPAVDALAELCARLPLALRLAAELATSRPSAPLADLIDELAEEQHRLDRLDDDGDTHAAMRSAFSWSYQQLGGPEAAVFRLLGLHPCRELDVEAIAALVGGDVASARVRVETLVQSHLVERTDDGRFQMHDLLRAYARELASTVDSEAVRATALNALADHYLRKASAAVDVIDPVEQVGKKSVASFRTYDDAMAWLESERANLLAVAEYAAAQDGTAHAGELSATLFRYLHLRGHHDDSLVLHTQALVASRRRSDRVGESIALTSLGIGYERLGRYEDALRHHQQAVDVAREAGDESLTGRVVKNAAVVFRRLGRYEEAEAALRQALSIAKNTDNRRGAVAVLSSMALVYENVGRYEEALSHLEEAWSAIPDVVNDHGLAGHTLANLGLVHLRLGRRAEARQHLDLALAGARATGNRDLESEVLDTLGELASAEGDPRQALEHHRLALALARRTGNRLEEARARAGIAAADG